MNSRDFTTASANMGDDEQPEDRGSMNVPSVSGWRVGVEGLPRPVDDRMRSHPQPGSRLKQFATVTIITDAVRRVVPGAAPQPTKGVRMTVDAEVTTVLDLKQQYERKYRATGGDPSAVVAHFETLGGRVLDHNNVHLTVAAAGVDGQALRAVFPRKPEPEAPPPEPPAADDGVDDLGVLDDDEDVVASAPVAPRPEPTYESLTPLERARRRKAKLATGLAKSLEPPKPPPQPIFTLPPNAFPPQQVKAAPEPAASSFIHKKYDKWNNFGDDSD